MTRKLLQFIGIISMVGIIFSVHTLAVFAGNPPDQAHSTISGTEVPADGSTWSTVTVTLQDASGTPLNNDQVTFSSTDSSTSFAPSAGTVQILDMNGRTQVQMKTTTVGAVNITVTDTSAGNAAVTGTVTFDQVTATPTITPTPTSAASCTNVAPGSTPQLLSAVSTGARTILLTWKDASDPVTYYELSYGLSAGKYIYGNPFVGGQGATTYTVGNLSTGTRYYFVIVAGNGCMSGPYSNEVSAVAGALPTPIPSDTTEVAPTDTVVDTPADPFPTDAPADTPQPTVVPAASVSSGNSHVAAIIFGSTGLGVLLIIGVTVWNVLEHRRRPPTS